MRVPNGWRMAPLSEFLRESRVPGGDGRTAKKLTVKLYGRGVLAKETATAGSENTKYYRRCAGQFIYSKLDFLNGAFGIVPPELDGRESTLDLPAFDILPGIVPEWLVFYVTREQFYSAYTDLARGGRKARRVSPEEFLRIEVPLPPLSEQRRIAEILSSVDEAIATTQAVIEQTRTVKQGVLKRLLTRGIGHTRFKQTEIGEIPEAWEVRPIDELCRLTNGNGFRPPDWSDQGLPIIRIQNLNGSRKFNYFAGLPKEKWIVEHGDLLFSWAGVRGVSFGPCLWTGPRGVLNQHIFKVHTAKGIRKKWLFHAMELVTARIEEKAHGFKASLLHVHKSEITSQLIGVPNESEQTEIVRAMESLSQAEAREATKLGSLRDVKSALMADLLTGRKQVPDTILAAAE